VKNRIESRHITVKIIGAFVALILIVPTLIVIPISFAGQASFIFPPQSWSLRWYEEFFTNRGWSTSLQRSLLIGFFSAIFATLLGTTSALGLAKWVGRRAAVSVRAVLLVPIVVPGIVLAIGIYGAFTVFGIIGTLPGFIVAHTVLGIPYVVISVTAALTGFDPNLERAAVSLGASRWQVARRVTLPLSAPGVMAGFLFAFVTSFDEILVSLFIKSPFLETLPVRMYTSVVSDLDPTIAAASTIVLVVTTVILVAGTLVVSRRTRILKVKV
jgi:putative spermidine/putrescine transport system permease protein